MTSAAPARRKATDWKVVTVTAEGRQGSKPDHLVAEEPMEIRAEAPRTEPQQISVTMRTPGHDFELAVGFLFTEGIITSPSDVRTVKYCELVEGEEQKYNIVTVGLARPFDLALARRAMVTSSSCGICGTESIDQLLTCTTPMAQDSGPVIDAATLLTVSDSARSLQPTFDRTGGLHAAALFHLYDSDVARFWSGDRCSHANDGVGLCALATADLRSHWWVACRSFVRRRWEGLDRARGHRSSQRRRQGDRTLRA